MRLLLLSVDDAKQVNRMSHKPLLHLATFGEIRAKFELPMRIGDSNCALISSKVANWSRGFKKTLNKVDLDVHKTT